MIRLRLLFWMTLLCVGLVTVTAFGKDFCPVNEYINWTQDFVQLSTVDTPLNTEFKQLPTVAADINKVKNIDDVVDKVLDDAVVLTFNAEQAFCSGQLARDSSGKVYVYSAAHCCHAYEFINASPDDMSKIKIALTRSGHELYIDNAEYAKGNIDSCRMEVKSKSIFDVVTPIVLWSVNTRLESLSSPTVLVVSRFPLYDEAKRISTLFITGFTLDKKHIVVAGNLYPGMSGSAIVDLQGNLVGHAVGYFPQTNVSVISILEMTQFLD